MVVDKDIDDSLIPIIRELTVNCHNSKCVCTSDRIALNDLTIVYMNKSYQYEFFFSVYYVLGNNTSSHKTLIPKIDVDRMVRNQKIAHIL